MDKKTYEELKEGWERTINRVTKERDSLSKANFRQAGKINSLLGDGYVFHNKLTVLLGGDIYDDEFSVCESIKELKAEVENLKDKLTYSKPLYVKLYHDTKAEVERLKMEVDDCGLYNETVKALEKAQLDIDRLTDALTVLSKADDLRIKVFVEQILSHKEV